MANSIRRWKPLVPLLRLNLESNQEFLITKQVFYH